MVTFVRARVDAPLLVMAPPSPTEPLLGRVPVAWLPVNVEFVTATFVPPPPSVTQSAPPWPTTRFPENVLPVMARAPFMWKIAPPLVVPTLSANVVSAMFMAEEPPYM
jgi:hypothetical protein